MTKAREARSKWCRPHSIPVVACLVAIVLGSYFALLTVVRIDRDQVDRDQPAKSLSPSTSPEAILDQPFGVLTIAESQQRQRVDDQIVRSAKRRVEDRIAGEIREETADADSRTDSSSAQDNLFPTLSTSLNT